MSLRGSSLLRCVFAAVALVGLTLPGVVRAQDAPQQPARRAAEPPGDFRARLERLHNAVLSLATDQQKAKVQEILDKTRDKLNALREEIRQDPDLRFKLQEKLPPILHEMQTSLNEVFGPEQKEKLAQLLTAVRLSVYHPLQELQEHLAKLDLTAEQKEKLQKLRAEVEEKMQKTREQAVGDRRTLLEKLREVRQAVATDLQSILTREQLRQLRELMQPSIQPATQPAEKN